MDRSILNKATSSDNAPTPGYLFDEIAKMTISSYEANGKVRKLKLFYELTPTTLHCVVSPQHTPFAILEMPTFPLNPNTYRFLHAPAIHIIPTGD
jgi:hypothetical protein